MHKRINLKNGTGLTCVTAEHTKTSCLSAVFQLPLGAEERSAAALLPMVLKNCSRACRGRQAVTARLENLYGARLEPTIRKRGEVQMVGFAADVIDERFAMSENSGLFTGTAQLMRDLLLDPDVFPVDIVQREAENLCQTIAALPNDKRSWAVRRMYQHMCAEEAYSAVEFGEIEQLRAITPEQLMQQYQRMLASAPLEIFYCGSLSAEQAAQQLSEAFAQRPELAQVSRPQTEIRSNVETVKHITETEPVKQGKLTLGFRTGITAADTAYPAELVFNACFGGTTNSRLFRTVREQMSLCYYASSQMDKSKGVIAVSSGLENKSAQPAEQEILHQLAEIQNGMLTEDEIAAAKRSLCAVIQTMQDSPLSMEGFYQTQAAIGLHKSADDLLAAVRQVTPEQVTEAAQRAVLDTVYFLKGEA